jgi:DNA primase
LLPKEVIEEIRLGTDLVKLIGEVVSLKRSGTNYSGRCPFHEEKTPSFSVSPSKQLYHCFGCSEGGTAITFMMKYYHLPFMDALQKLADRLRIDLTKYQQKQNTQVVESKKKMLDVISYAAQKYHNALPTSFGKTAVEYLTKKRGISHEMITEFQIGFAPDGWDHMLKALTRDNKPLDAAIQTGILAKRLKKDGVYDVFRNRIIVPIRNAKNELVGFGGRAFGDEQPKYLNSPQSDIFDKSRLLFGLSQAEQSIREKDFVILVEGYFDQITLYQYGFKNTVATLGTAFTEYHAELLKRYTDKIIVVFDGDKAGLSASKRSMSPLLSNGFNAKLVRIPGGQDPDLYVREKGVVAFESLIQNAKPLADEMIDLCYNQEKDLQKKALFLEDLSDILHKTKNIYYQEVLLEDFSKKTDVDKNRLLQSALKPEVKNVKSVPVIKTPETYREELTLLRVYAEAIEFRKRINNEDILSLFPEGEFLEATSKWLEQVAEVQYSDDKNVSALVDLWGHDSSRSKFTEILMRPWESKEGFYEKTYQECVTNLKDKKAHRLTATLPGTPKEGFEEILREIQWLKKTRSAGQGS